MITELSQAKPVLLAIEKLLGDRNKYLQINLSIIHRIDIEFKAELMCARWGTNYPICVLWFEEPTLIEYVPSPYLGVVRNNSRIIIDLAEPESLRQLIELIKKDIDMMVPTQLLTFYGEYLKKDGERQREILYAIKQFDELRMVNQGEP